MADTSDPAAPSGDPRERFLVLVARYFDGDLNETETELIARLVPKQQVLLKRPDYSKVLNLNVDPAGYWLYTSNPFENQRRREAFEKHGFARGLQILTGSAL